LEKRAEQVLPGSDRRWVGMRGRRTRGRNDPNNVQTYEYMNKEKKDMAIGEQC
jgi:hypothetical protein